MRKIKTNLDMKKAMKIAVQVNKLANLDVFKNTRRREYVEARSLLCFILYKYQKFNLHEIKNFLIDNGKSSDHTTVLYSIKNYEIYSHYNKELMNWLTCITGKIELQNNEAKRELIKLKVNYISNKDVDEVAFLVDLMAKKELEATD